jgi:hypothetical protein
MRESPAAGVATVAVEAYALAGMTPQFRWAARYALLDELWRDRPRIIHDPELEAFLRDGEPGAGSHLGEPEGLPALLDVLVPRRRGDTAVWMAVHSAEVAAALARKRPGTTFLPLDGWSDAVRRAAWDVALVALGDEHLATEDGPNEDDEDGGLSDAGRAFVEELGPHLRAGRLAVLATPVKNAAARGLDYDDVSTLLAETWGGGRIFGVYLPAIAAVVDFGERIESEHPDDVFGSGAGFEVELVDEVATERVDLAGESLEPEDVPLSYDNTLGSQVPRVIEYIAVAGSGSFAESVEGLSLIELPDPPARATDASRAADLITMERHVHAERLRELQRSNAALREEVEVLRDRLARATRSPPPPEPAQPQPEPAERLDAALAREQGLRWQVTQLQHELHSAVARPIEDLESEVASLRARLSTATAVPQDLALVHAASGSNGTTANGSGSAAMMNLPLATRAVAVGASGGVGAPSVAQVVISAMDGLVRRIERGGIGTLQLRRELVAIRKRLRS